MNSIEQMVVTINTKNIQGITVTLTQLDYWKKQWLFDAVAGLRLGQSFCKYFGVSNAAPLYHFKDNNTSMRWIRDNYLQDETEIC